MKTLKINTAIQILKPIDEVFESIINPKQMSNYFIAEGSARMEEGKELEWKFHEFDEKVPIKVLKIKQNEFISFQWDGAPNEKLIVEMTLSERPDNATLLRITEGEMENNDAGIKWLKGNTEGWANFSACLKAYLEYGINLRKGAFDFMKTSQ